MFFIFLNIFLLFLKSVVTQVCHGKHGWLRVRFPMNEEMKYLFTFIFQFFRSGVETKRGVPPEFGGNAGTANLNTKFALPIPLCAGNSVKLIYLYIFHFIFRNENEWKIGNLVFKHKIPHFLSC